MIEDAVKRNTHIILIVGHGSGEGGRRRGGGFFDNELGSQTRLVTFVDVTLEPGRRITDQAYESCLW